MGRPRILIVDDEETIRHVLTVVLERNDCEVRSAGSAEEAFPIVAEWEPEVALLDIVLPGKNGLQLLSEIKKTSRDTEVLMMTSNSSAETALTAIRQGASDYLKKPFEVPEIWATVLRAIEKRGLTLRNRALLEEQEKLTRELSTSVQLPARQEPRSDHHSFTEILEYFLDVVTRELRVEKATLMLLDRPSGELRIASSRGVPASQAAEFRISVGEGIAGEVAKTGESFVDDGKDGRVLFHSRSDLSSAFLSVPIALSVAIKSDDEMIGVVSLSPRSTGRRFGPDDVNYVTGLAGQLAVAIKGARHSEELRKTYESLKATQDQLVFAERVKAVGQMAAGIAHDFNNVLCVIMGRTELALKSAMSQELDRSKIRFHLETIAKAAQQGATVIGRIQDYTRFKKDVPDSPVNVSTVLRDAVEIAKPKWKEQSEAEGRHISIEFRLADVPAVSGNMYELIQVVGNLIFNAVEAMPRGGTLTLRSFTEDEMVVFEVQDSGSGMDEETQKHVFSPFFTTKDRGQGLGTSIIQGIVSRHGGQITFKSKIGQGTTFTVRLPMLEEQAKNPMDDSVVTSGDTARARVLFVDDDADVRSLYEDTLVNSGHRVRTVEDGRQALQILSKEKFDVVVTDLNMPEMTGLELAKEVKRRDAGLPVILLTGWAVPQRQESLKDAGIDYLIFKPSKFEVLLGAIQELLHPTRAALDSPSEPATSGVNSTVDAADGVHSPKR